MNNQFFEKPILNGPYGYPLRHWELDADGQPTQQIKESRRLAEFITPIPKPKKRRGGDQASIVFDEGAGLSTAAQRYDHTAIINAVRQEVDKWRQIPSPGDWRVSPETARLLQHWRGHKFSLFVRFFARLKQSRRRYGSPRSRRRSARRASVFWNISATPITTPIRS